MTRTPVEPIGDLEPIPEKFVPDVMKADGRYRQGGYRCTACSFVTVKRGFSGKQALRAHRKVHVNERRAWFRPLVSHGLVSATLVALLLLPLGGIGSPRPVVTLAIDSSMVGWVIAGLALILGILGFLLGEWAEYKLSRGIVRLIPMITFLGYFLTIVAVSMSWGFLTPDLSWPSIAAVIAMLTGQTLGEISASTAALWIKRGRWRSPRYMTLFRPRDEDAEIDYRHLAAKQRSEQLKKHADKRKPKPRRRSKEEQKRRERRSGPNPPRTVHTNRRRSAEGTSAAGEKKGNHRG